MNTSKLPLTGLIVGDAPLRARSEFVKIIKESFSANARLTR